MYAMPSKTLYSLICFMTIPLLMNQVGYVISLCWDTFFSVQQLNALGSFKTVLGVLGGSYQSMKISCHVQILSYAAQKNVD